MSDPTLRLLSLGAGVQSTTLALMAVDGTLPGLDAAIFADTGWEPAGVYEHLDRLQPVLEAAGIAVHRVSNGNLRTDTVDPSSRFASIPYYTRQPAGPCAGCAGTGNVELGPTPQAPTGLTLKCVRCGGTGTSDGLGMGRRQCTKEYKVQPINVKVRELLGAEPPKYRSVKRGRVAEQWVGFSTDESDRALNQQTAHQVRYVRKRYPLLELGMSRTDCERYLRLNGWGSVSKSACIGCPFHGNRQWRDLRDNHPDEWADAVAFDTAIRKGGAGGLSGEFDGEAFLHRSRIPLSLAPIDRVTRREWHDRQGDLLDTLADLEAEEGRVYACSPEGDCG